MIRILLLKGGILVNQFTGVAFKFMRELTVGYLHLQMMFGGFYFLKGTCLTTFLSGTTDHKHTDDSKNQKIAAHSSEEVIFLRMFG